MAPFTNSGGLDCEQEVLLLKHKRTECFAVNHQLEPGHHQYRDRQQTCSQPELAPIQLANQLPLLHLHLTSMATRAPSMPARYQQQQR